MPATTVRPVPDQAPQCGPIQQSIALVSPRWSVWILQSLSRNDSRLQADLQSALPMINTTTLYQRLQQLTEDGLVERTRHDGRTNAYALTGAGQEMGQALDLLGNWARAHRPTGQATARAQVIEQALVPLSHSFATDALLELERGPASWSDLLDVLPTGTIHMRLASLEEHGLVNRSGEPRNHRWHLTTAGLALGPTFDALDDWAHDHLPASPRPAVSPAKAAALTAHSSVPVVSAAPATRRAEAANLRSLTSRLLFSNPAEPQPAPLIVSAPAAMRGR
ncbi:winged helix-turn-helix transcriptional regulator [Kitasatospora sp. NPDC004669]|uniref:winged helix-turn-helix transcriptional regulator n=1 Tax=Kitasatospora sp. NPDC004669 TaxID=3154555 RepID=UPI0033B0ACF2